MTTDPMAYTRGPWRIGSWSGQCHKEHPERLRGGHPGPGGPNGCVYDPVFHEGSGIAGPEPGQVVVGTSYDELVIRDADARLIAVAPEMYELLKELIDIEGPQPGHVEWFRKVQAVLIKAGAT